MVFTIITYYYYNHVRRHLYGVYHHNITSLLEGTSMVFTITTYYNPVRRHLYGVYHHNLLQAC